MPQFSVCGAINFIAISVSILMTQHLPTYALTNQEAQEAVPALEKTFENKGKSQNLTLAESPSENAEGQQRDRGIETQGPENQAASAKKPPTPELPRALNALIGYRKYGFSRNICQAFQAPITAARDFGQLGHLLGYAAGMWLFSPLYTGSKFHQFVGEVGVKTTLGVATLLGALLGLSLSPFRLLGRIAFAFFDAAHGEA